MTGTTEAEATVRPPASPPGRGWLRKALVSLFIVVAIAAAATARVVWAGEKEIVKSTEALRTGDADRAITHARGAAYWYVPGAPHVRVAYGRLMTIAKEAERRRLWDTALFAYRAVQSASTSTRWIGAPHAEDAAEAARAIARIEASVGMRAPTPGTESREVLEQQLLASFAEDLGPSRFYRVVLVASFLAMLGGLGAFLLFGLEESGRVRLARATPALVAAALGLAGYCAALLLA